MAKIEGGCLCGKIRYSGEADPLAAVVCNCTSCQKQTGSAYSVNLVMPKGSLDIQGEMAVYTHTGDSGQPLYRNFCGNCGSSVTSELSVMDTVVILKAGSLDDTSWVKPTTEIYCDSAQEWTRVKTELESHPKMMPS